MKFKDIKSIYDETGKIEMDSISVDYKFDVSKAFEMCITNAEILFDNFEEGMSINPILKDMLFAQGITSIVTDIDFEEDDSLMDFYNLYINTGMDKYLRIIHYYDIVEKMYNDYISEVKGNKTNVQIAMIKLMNTISEKIPDSKQIEKLSSKIIKDINKMDKGKIESLTNFFKTKTEE